MEMHDIFPLFIRFAFLWLSGFLPFSQLSFVWEESNHLLVAKVSFIFYFELFWYHQLVTSSFVKCLSLCLLVLLLLENSWPAPRHSMLLWDQPWYSCTFLGRWLMELPWLLVCFLASWISVDTQMVLELHLSWFRQRFIKEVLVTIR